MVRIRFCGFSSDPEINAMLLVVVVVVWGRAAAAAHSHLTYIYWALHPFREILAPPVVWG